MKGFSILVALSVALAAGPALAEESRPDSASGGASAPLYWEERKAVKAEFEKEKKELRDRLEAKREAFRLEREKVRAEIEARREAAREKLEALKESIRNDRDEARAERKTRRISLRERALSRFDKIAGKLAELKDRVARHVEKFKAKGVDTAVAEGYLSQAGVKLDQVKSKIAELHVLFSSSIDPLLPENKAKMKALEEEIRTLFREAHKLLKDTVRSLRASIRPETEREEDSSGDE